MNVSDPATWGSSAAVQAVARARLLDLLAPTMSRRAAAEIAVEAIPSLVGADGAVAFLVAEDGHIDVAAHAAPPSGRSLVEAVGGSSIRIAPDSKGPAAEAVRWGWSSVWRDPRSDGCVETFPLKAGDSTVGALSLIYLDAGAPVAEQLSKAVAVQVLADALGRAQVHERETEAVSEYARTRAPRRLPTVPGMEFGASFTADAANDPPSGGGWYDIIQTGPSRVLLAVGRVAAAPAPVSVAAGVRQTLAAYAVLTQEPEELSAMLAEFQRKRPDLAGSHAVTIARFDAADGVLAWASQGTPPPLVLRGGTVVELGASTPGTGVAADIKGDLKGEATSREDHRGNDRLHPGDTLLLPSAELGLWPGKDRDRRDSQLVAIADRLSEQSPVRLCEALLKTLNAERASDPGLPLVALLVLSDRGSRSWRLTSSRTSPGIARQHTRRELARLGVFDDTSIENAELLVTELVANVVKHVADDAELRIHRTGQTIRIEVLDSGHEETLEVPATDVLAERGRGLLLIDSLADNWGVDQLDDGKQVWVELELAPD